MAVGGTAVGGTSVTVGGTAVGIIGMFVGILVGINVGTPTGIVAIGWRVGSTATAVGRATPG